mgnify:CR=1 FL=1
MCKACDYTIHGRQHHFGWDNSLVPAERVAPGSTILFHCHDSSAGQLGPSSTLQDVVNLDFVKHMVPYDGSRMLVEMRDGIVDAEHKLDDYAGRDVRGGRGADAGKRRHIAVAGDVGRDRSGGSHRRRSGRHCRNRIRGRPSQFGSRWLADLR